jgi:tRNA 2-thiouridine synthesizing protein A
MLRQPAGVPRRGPLERGFRQLQDLSMNFDKELDARGLNCPLPILKAKKTLSDMTSGQILRILATDPGSVKDFQAFSKQTGNALLDQSATENEFTFFLRKK